MKSEYAFGNEHWRNQPDERLSTYDTMKKQFHLEQYEEDDYSDYEKNVSLKSTFGVSCRSVFCTGNEFDEA